MNRTILLVPVVAAVLLATIPIVMAQTNQTNATAATTSSNMTQYTDRQGRFSIAYPSGWTVQPANNTIGSLSTIAQFVSSSGASLNIVIDTNNSNTDPATSANASIATMPSGYSVSQNVGCTQYTIDGQKACGYIVTGAANSTAGIPAFAIMQLGSHVNGNMYVFTMTSSQDTFDSNLSTFQAMLNSFTAPAK
jgi:hypothetical protein